MTNQLFGFSFRTFITIHPGVILFQNCTFEQDWEEVFCAGDFFEEIKIYSIEGEIIAQNPVSNHEQPAIRRRYKAILMD